jgi:transcriptional regulator with XRE-family HTH domain
MEVTNLRAYLANIGMSMKQFADMLECDRTYMSLIANGRRLAGRRLAKDIEEATGGVIKLKTNPNKCGPRKRREQSVANIS